MATNLPQNSSTMKLHEKKQGKGFLCFSCLGKGRPPSSLIPEEISSLLNDKDKDSVYNKEDETTWKDKKSNKLSDIQGNKNKSYEINNSNNLNGHDGEHIYEVCDNPSNNAPEECRSISVENQGHSPPSVVATNTTSPSHMSLSQAPTNTISSQLSSHRFPSTGLSSPPPPLKCAFLVR